MEKHDLRPTEDLRAAVSLLTRLPVPGGSREEEHVLRGAKAAWAWPLAGVLVGAIGAAVAEVALALGVPVTPSALLALAAMIGATGALHEDGLADAADGLWGGWTRERRLEIMRDSRIGTYGVLALGLGLLLRFSAISYLVAAQAHWAGLILVGAASRAPMAWLMANLPNARDEGLSKGAGRPEDRVVWIGIGLAGLVALILWPGAVIPVAAIVALLAVLWGRLARAKIGGQTGDIVGAGQQIAEIGALLTLSALVA